MTYGPDIPPEFAHLWDPETGRWKDGALVKMLEILTPKTSTTAAAGAPIREPERKAET